MASAVSFDRPSDSCPKLCRRTDAQDYQRCKQVASSQLRVPTTRVVISSIKGALLTVSKPAAL
ncbi:MAG: hypothetical protein ACJASK_002326, partial [Ilumatobacter sp.]